MDLDDLIRELQSYREQVGHGKLHIALVLPEPAMGNVLSHTHLTKFVDPGEVNYEVILCANQDHLTKKEK